MNLEEREECERRIALGSYTETEREVLRALLKFKWADRSLGGTAAASAGRTARLNRAADALRDEWLEGRPRVR
jgi:hypothetical protein